MTRKQTIIVAVLVNAALLVILFTSALKTELEPEPSSSKEEMAIKPAEMSQPPLFSPPTLIHESLASLPESQPIEIMLPKPEVSIPISPFAEELKNSFPAPTATVSSSDISASKGVLHVTVKKGDVLEKIARSHHTTVDEIIKLNRLESTQLKIGQVLKVMPKQVEAASEAGRSSAQFYTVKNGDNPWTIAVKNHMKVEELLKLNDLDQEKARKLKPGDQLRIK